jgi:hypothetical protein
MGRLWLWQIERRSDLAATAPHIDIVNPAMNRFALRTPEDRIYPGKRGEFEAIFFVFLYYFFITKISLTLIQRIVYCSNAKEMHDVDNFMLITGGKYVDNLFKQ